MIQYPDQERVIPTFLRSVLPDDVFVGRTRPINPRSKIVTIRRQGGQGARRYRRLDSVRIGVNVWADSDVDANDLAARVIAALMHAGDIGLAKNIDVTGPAEVMDDTTQHRRYFTADYLARGSAITPNP